MNAGSLDMENSPLPSFILNLLGMTFRFRASIAASLGASVLRSGGKHGGPLRAMMPVLDGA